MRLARLIRSSKSQDPKAPRWRMRLHYRVQAALQYLGVPGVMAIGLVFFCAMVWGSALSKLASEKAAIEYELASIAPTPAHPPSMQDRQAELTAYHATFPEASRTAVVIGQLHAYAETAGVRLANTDFRLTESKARDLPALLVTVDITAGHEQTVKFINQVLAGMPNAAMEAVAFKRGKLADTVLETQLRFRLYVKIS